MRYTNTCVVPHRYCQLANDSLPPGFILRLLVELLHIVTSAFPLSPSQHIGPPHACRAVMRDVPLRFERPSHRQAWNWLVEILFPALAKLNRAGLCHRHVIAQFHKS